MITTNELTRAMKFLPELDAYMKECATAGIDKAGATFSPKRKAGLKRLVAMLAYYDRRLSTPGKEVSMQDSNENN